MEFNPHKVLTNNVDMLEDIGLFLSPRPKTSAPDFPEDISSLAPLEISNLMIIYTAWYAYSSSTEAYANAEVGLLKNQMDYLAAHSYLTSGLKTIEDRKIAKYNEEKYVILSQQYQEAVARYELLKNLTSSYDKFLWSLSRILTTLAVEDTKGKY